MLRSVLGVFVGIVIAVMLIAGIEQLGHRVYPPPASIRAAAEKRDFQAVAKAVGEWMPTAPIGALVFPPLAWFGGTLAGCLAAVWIAGRAPFVHAGISAVLPLLGTIASLAMIPHPPWMWAAGLIGVPLAALVAGFLGPRRPPAGPQPQDMRAKNMAC